MQATHALPVADDPETGGPSPAGGPGPTGGPEADEADGPVPFGSPEADEAAPGPSGGPEADGPEACGSAFSPGLISFDGGLVEDRDDELEDFLEEVEDDELK